jgi:hypothetical protein
MAILRTSPFERSEVRQSNSAAMPEPKAESHNACCSECADRSDSKILASAKLLTADPARVFHPTKQN